MRYYNMMQLKKRTWAGYVAKMRGMINTLVRKSDAKSLGRSSCGWDASVQIGVKQTGWQNLTEFICFRIGAILL
jgi:hypothetical protein